MNNLKLDGQVLKTIHDTLFATKFPVYTLPSGLEITFSPTRDYCLILAKEIFARLVVCAERGSDPGSNSAGVPNEASTPSESPVLDPERSEQVEISGGPVPADGVTGGCAGSMPSSTEGPLPRPVPGSENPNGGSEPGTEEDYGDVSRTGV